MTETPGSHVSAQIVIRSVPVDVVRPLRHRVLRPGFPEESVHTDRDDDPNTVHLAAIDGDEVIGVVSMLPEPFPDDTRTAQRFRWMAVDATRRGSGTGQALIRRVAAVALESGSELIWAHGRDTALGFYERLGFRVVGDGYTDAVTHIQHHFVVIEASALTQG